ncbi:uncharacterized protein V1513DRAFT_481754 [Lipomyces chichibuensis]|uniref:uncharacterized protein n=1 Tax=Lipomyces chichibuensis TaxID=1546026 RepID=UPI0033439AF3
MVNSLSPLLEKGAESRSGCSVVRFGRWFNKSIRHFHESRMSHIFVIGLVIAEALLTLTELYLELYSCEHHLENLRDALPAIAGMSLAIATLFFVELLSALYVFGFAYFTGKGRWLRILDAVVILGSFIVEIMAHGPLAEAVELIVVLRFWRIGKVAEESYSETKEKIEHLEEENHELRIRLNDLDKVSIDSREDALNEKAGSLDTEITQVA